MGFVGDAAKTPDRVKGAVKSLFALAVVSGVAWETLEDKGAFGPAIREVADFTCDLGFEDSTCQSIASDIDDVYERAKRTVGLD